MGYIHIRLYFWQIDMPDNLSIQQKGRLLLKSNIFYFKKQPSLLLIREVIWQASDFFGESSLKGGEEVSWWWCSLLPTYVRGMAIPNKGKVE